MAGRRCAEWRFPTLKQQRKEEMERLLRQTRQPERPDKECWWDAVLEDPRASAPARPIQDLELGAIGAELLRVSCLRCMRTVEIRRNDAIKLYGVGSVWRAVAMHLLADGCQHRTGRYEEDGCWPEFKT